MTEAYNLFLKFPRATLHSAIPKAVMLKFLSPHGVHSGHHGSPRQVPLSLSYYEVQPPSRGESPPSREFPICMQRFYSSLQLHTRSNRETAALLLFFPTILFSLADEIGHESQKCLDGTCNLIPTFPTSSSNSPRMQNAQLFCSWTGNQKVIAKCTSSKTPMEIQ